MSHLEARVVVRRPQQVVDVTLDAEPGDVVAVIGPNGAGKTTLLRALAGLLPMDEGTLTCAGQTWAGPGVGRPRTPQERDIGMVFQQQLLFPHLDATSNVAFGPRSRGRGRAESVRTARLWLDRLGVLDLADRRPHQLSGGQAQRVAIARALATDPSLLLLDEPLAALDVAVAMALRIELAEHLADFGGVSVLVTHDAIDTMTVANRVVVLDDGKVAQVGTPDEVARQPQTEHVARLVGLNVLRGRSRGTQVTLADGSQVVSVTELDGDAFVSFAPSAVTLTVDEPVGSARNRWHGTVRSAVPHGSAVRVHLDNGAEKAATPAAGPAARPAPGSATSLTADVTPSSALALGLAPGRDVWAAVKATEVVVYPTAAAPLRSRYVAE